MMKSSKQANLRNRRFKIYVLDYARTINFNLRARVLSSREVKMYKLKLLTISLAVLFGLALSPTKAFAQSLEVEFEGLPINTGSVFDLSADGLWLPGYSKTKQLTVSHTGNDPQQIKVSIDDFEDPENLAGVFNLEIRDSENNPYYIGSLKNFFNLDFLNLATQATNQIKTYSFTIALPPTIGNEWQNKEARFDFSIFVEGSNPTPGPGGDDGVHLVCASSNQCVIVEGEGGNDSGCSFAGEHCNYQGTGDLPGTTNPSVQGVSTSIFTPLTRLFAQGGSAVEVEGEPEPEVKGVEKSPLSDSLAGVVEGATTTGECCCLWWVFILLMIIGMGVYRLVTKRRSATVVAGVLFYAAFGLGAYILYRLLCTWLTNLIGCIWPSQHLIFLCRYFILIDLLVFVIGSILLWLSARPKTKLPNNSPSPHNPNPVTRV